MAALQLTAQHDALQPQVAAIDAALKQGQGSDITQELITLDDERDNTLTGPRAVINGHQYHFEQATSNAAKALLSNVDNHGTNIQRSSYQEQTAVLDGIIADREGQAELTAAVGTLNLTAWLAHLRTTNGSFATRYLARGEEQAANPTGDIPQLREEATAPYRALIAHVEAHATLGQHHSTALYWSRSAYWQGNTVRSLTVAVQPQATAAPRTGRTTRPRTIPRHQAKPYKKQHQNATPKTPLINAGGGFPFDRVINTPSLPLAVQPIDFVLYRTVSCGLTKGSGHGTANSSQR